MKIRPEYYYFGIIGGIGFIIDAGVFALFHSVLNYPISRMISILIAMTFTWVFNRTFTFKYAQKISHREWLKYLTVNGTGAVINFSIFLLLCHVSVVMKQYYIVPLVCATSVSMVFNFTMSKWVVFRA